MSTRALGALSWIGMGSFVALTGAAIYRYPGGTSLDPAAVGFSWLGNYWCDLLDPLAQNGAENPGRLWAVGGTVALLLGNVAFWLALPRRVAMRPGVATLVRLLGVGSTLATLWSFSPSHDAAILVGAPAGFITMLATAGALAQRGRHVLATGASLVLAAAMLDFVLWQQRLLPWVTPVVQKLGIGLFIAWAAAVLVSCAARDRRPL